jgi:type II secretory ATPase GspE/PulE/Tfp pilus assembly ATPase PilB-like protein
MTLPSFAKNDAPITVQPKQPSRAELAQLQTQLNQAKAKWQKQQPLHYSYALQRTCFCPPEYNRPINIRVFKGKVQQATLAVNASLVNGRRAAEQPLAADRKSEAMPMEGLFKIIQDAIQRKASSLKVTYNKQYGYPLTIAIDYNSMIADEEAYWTISNFKIASGLKPSQVK